MPEGKIHLDPDHRSQLQRHRCSRHRWCRIKTPTGTTGPGYKKKTRRAGTPSGRREARRVSDREIANQSAERIHLPAPT